VKQRLVVLCDGTWNRPDQPTPTNVCKLRDAVDVSEGAAVPQRVHYERGVGARRWERIRGGAFGLGLSRNVRDGYAFLVDHYRPGDELFLFGFSRGAFTARSLAGLVRNSGILQREHRGMVDDAYRLYRSRKPQDAPWEAAAGAFRQRYSHSDDVEITFVGVWDTVGALGIPIDGFRPPLLSKRWTFHDTTLSRSVRNAYHAISIDERRRPFVPTLWVEKRDEHGKVEPRPEHQRVSQVWFAGVHSDVGGGYHDPALSEIPLRWMVDRARDCGLVLEPDHLAVVPAAAADLGRRRDGVEIAPDPCGPKHDSMTFFYRLLRPLDRGLTAAAGIPINASLGSSVKVRCERDRSYTAPALAEWLARGPVTDVEGDAPGTSRSRPA
jgi:uncharacterized protein (DUF2235 family)